jgi:hypothetical protein
MSITNKIMGGALYMIGGLLVLACSVVLWILTDAPFDSVSEWVVYHRFLSLLAAAHSLSMITRGVVLIGYSNASLRAALAVRSIGYILLPCVSVALGIESIRGDLSPSAGWLYIAGLILFALSFWTNQGR